MTAAVVACCCVLAAADAGVPMTDEERTAILTWILCGFPM